MKTTDTLDRSISCEFTPQPPWGDDTPVCITLAHMDGCDDELWLSLREAQQLRGLLADAINAATAHRDRKDGNCCNDKPQTGDACTADEPQPKPEWVDETGYSSIGDACTAPHATAFEHGGEWMATAKRYLGPSPSVTLNRHHIPDRESCKADAEILLAILPEVQAFAEHLYAAHKGRKVSAERDATDGRR